MRTCQTLALCLLTLLAITAWGGEIYRWVDANGKVHFSDKTSRKDAATVTLQSGNRYGGGEASRHDREASRVSGKTNRAIERDSHRSAKKIVHKAGKDAITEEQIRQQMEACEDARNVDCSEQKAVSSIQSDRYWKSPDGQREKMRRRLIQCRRFYGPRAKYCNNFALPENPDDQEHK